MRNLLINKALFNFLSYSSFMIRKTNQEYQKNLLLKYVCFDYDYKYKYIFLNSFH